MINKEVNDWIKKVECGCYSKDDAMYEFRRLSRFLTREELSLVKRKVESFLNIKE